VIVVGGADGWCEAFEPSVAAYARRGLSVCLLELPGQGLARLEHGLKLEAGFTQAISSCIDVLQTRGARAFGLAGHSLGGTLALAAAAQEPRILGRPNLELDGDGWLLVDDLVDSGVTVRTIRALFPAVTVAVLYAKPAGEDLAHAFVRRVKQDTWIVFPWERTERAGASAGPAAEGLSPASHDPPSSTHVPPPRRDPASA
ncbi:MAG: alpha/beta fold hydrolase, partial [Rhodospirillales bacterium]|nr:alpha/beta fold hydrolase [Rhodospirillales bacterium]